MDGKKRHLEHFHRKTVAGGRQEKLPGTLSREFRARWTAGKDTWNTFAGIPCQVDGRKSYLERFRGNSVPGGRLEVTPGTLSQEFRARWKAGKDTWNAFAGIPCQVEGGERHLEHFCRKTVPGGRQGKDTWNAFAGKPCQVGDRERTPGTLLQRNRARWTARRDTWNTFTGKPWQGDGRKSYLERFRGNTVPGGRQEETPGTLSQENRGRGTAGKDTWNDKVRLEVNMRFKCAYWNIISSYG